MYVQIGDLCEWTNDSHCLIMSNFDGICYSPTGLYRWPLLFCPSSSWLHIWYTAESVGEVKVVKGRPDEWKAYTREVHIGGGISTIMCRKDIIAVGGTTGKITILDAITGRNFPNMGGMLRPLLLHWMERYLCPGTPSNSGISRPAES